MHLTFLLEDMIDVKGTSLAKADLHIWKICVCFLFCLKIMVECHVDMAQK